MFIEERRFKSNDDRCHRIKPAIKYPEQSIREARALQTTIPYSEIQRPSEIKP